MCKGKAVTDGGREGEGEREGGSEREDVREREREGENVCEGGRERGRSVPLLGVRIDDAEGGEAHLVERVFT